MAKNKSQHFVPQVLLRQFRCSQTEKATHLWMPKKGIFRNKVSIRDQCAKPFLYGKDLELEEFYQVPERFMGAALRKISSNEKLGQSDLKFLLLFWLIQRNRSYLALSDLQRAFDEVRSRAFKSKEDSDFLGEELKPDVLARMTLSQTEEQLAHLVDLEITILSAPKRASFFLSDHPASFSSKFLHQKHSPSVGFGIAASGVFCVLPLTPIYCLLAYDANVYCSLRSPKCLASESDVAAINSLTLMNCGNSIYFHDWTACTEIESYFGRFVDKIPNSRFRINLATEQKHARNSSSRYFKTTEDDEFYRSERGLIHWQYLNPRPPLFPPILKYKIKPKFIDTHSGLGLVRPNSQALQRYHVDT